MLRFMRLSPGMFRYVRPLLFRAVSLFLLPARFAAGEGMARNLIGAQRNEQPTPIQRELERQRQRLKSEDIEDRRDALMRLGNLKRTDASRIAAGSLADV